MSEVLLVLVGLVGLCLLLFMGEPSRTKSNKTHVRSPVPRRLRGKACGEPRIVLGRLRGRDVAAEPHHSVLVIGPTQSGKTSRLVVPAIAAWPGPVLVSSVKGDVLSLTRRDRAAFGPLSVIDPSRSTGATANSWRPYCSLQTFHDARALARDLCAASSAVTPSGDGEFWLNAAARYLAPLFLAGARCDAPLTVVQRWMDDEDVGEALSVLEASGDHDAHLVLLQLLRRDARQLHSIVTTAEVVMEALVDGAGEGPEIDLDHFLGSCGTLYLCAPLLDQQRSRALLTGLRNEVTRKASHLALKQGGRLTSPLLIVQDEAGHSAGLEQLSALAATGVGQGITVLTVFQDMGQILHDHGALASSLVLNHRARVLMAGTIDQASVDLFVTLSGEQRRRERSQSHSRQGRSQTEHEVTSPRLERHQLATLMQGSGVVLYDALPPFFVRLSAKRKRRAPTAVHARPKGRHRARVARGGEER